jgi:HK97 family phage major capsid protein
LQYLDTLKDNNARYLLTPDPTNPATMRLAVGAMTVPITVIPNADMPTDSENGRIPFLIGDLKEAIWFFDRKSLTLKQSDVAVVGNSNAFRQDLTFVRAITRFDCVARDTAALVNGYIPVG